MKGVPRKILEMTKYDDKNILLIYTNSINMYMYCIFSWPQRIWSRDLSADDEATMVYR